MSDPVRTAVVGLGYWGPNLVRNLQEFDEAELVAVCDLDDERLSLVGRRYPGVRRTTGTPTCSATPRSMRSRSPRRSPRHFRLAMAAIAAGKHVFIEKPLAASHREADAS